MNIFGISVIATCIDFFLIGGLSLVLTAFSVGKHGFQIASKRRKKHGASEKLKVHGNGAKILQQIFH